MAEHSNLHAGFTAVELLIVIGIMMILLAIAAPSIMPAIRRGKINDAVNDITDCWRQARALAIITPAPPGLNPPHFGVVIDQTSGQRPYAAVCFDNSADGARLWQRGMDPRDPTTWGISATPVMKHDFSRQIILVTTPAGGGAPTTGDRRLAVYAQYGTGLPISPSDVATGQGLSATPTSLGIATASVTTSACPVVQIQTLDFATAPSRRGYASQFSLYHAGFTSAREQ